ncbi:MAG: glycosyltransferase family 4 protein [Sphingomonadaceae bacterium]
MTKTKAVCPRLWIVSELYYPEQTSTGYFLTRIAEGLADDFDVQVVCGQPSYSERGVRAVRRETRNGTTIHRLASTHFDKDRLLLRLINAVSLTIAAFFFALRHFRKGDRVLVVTNPPTMPAVIGLAARLKRTRAALLVHDVYPELLAATGLIGRTSLIYRLLARMFRLTYRLFGDVIVLGADMAEIVESKLGAGHASRITIIPNWGDIDEVVPIDRNANDFRQAHGMGDRFVVQFSGNIGRTHDVELLLEAARLIEDRVDIVFLFVGYGGKAAMLTEPAAARPNVCFLPRQPRERLGAMLAASDVTVIPFVDGMYGISVPSRMYNVMAAGVPIIAAADASSELAQTIDRLGAGWVLSPRTPNALATMVRALAEPEGMREIARRGAAGRAGVERFYALDAILAQYRNLL